MLEVISFIIFLVGLFLVSKYMLFDPIKDAINKLEQTVAKLCEDRINNLEKDVFKIRNCLERIEEDNKFKK